MHTRTEFDANLALENTARLPAARRDAPDFFQYRDYLYRAGREAPESASKRRSMFRRMFPKIPG